MTTSPKGVGNRDNGRERMYGVVSCCSEQAWVRVCCTEVCGGWVVVVISVLVAWWMAVAAAEPYKHVLSAKGKLQGLICAGGESGQGCSLWVEVHGICWHIRLCRMEDSRMPA